MCRAPAAWAWWPAVGAPFERSVRPHSFENRCSLGIPWPPFWPCRSAQARAVAVLRVCGGRNGTAWRCAPCFKVQPALAEAFYSLLGRFLGSCLDFVCCHVAIAAVSRFRRQGRRPRVFGLAGFKPALTKVQPSVANGSQPHALVLPIAALARP